MPIRRPSAPQSDRLGDYPGRLIAIYPERIEDDFDTAYGPTSVMWAKVLLCDDETPGAYNNLGTVAIFWKGVQQQLFDGMGEWTGGRLLKGTERNPKAWVLADPTDDELVVLEKVLAAVENF